MNGEIAFGVILPLWSMEKVLEDMRMELAHTLFMELMDLLASMWYHCAIILV